MEMNSKNCEEEQQQDKFTAKLTQSRTHKKTILTENEPTFGFNLPINI
jgi:hypothetical protein